MGTVYALAIAIFGGSAQFIEQALVHWTGNPMAPAYYMTVALAVGLIGILILKEPRRDRSGAEVAHLDPALLS